MIREGQELRQHIHSQCDASRVGTESLERVERLERECFRSSRGRAHSRCSVVITETK